MNLAKKIVLASNNAGKLREFQHLFKSLPVQFSLQSEFEFEEAKETATTFLENALIKARHAAYYTKLPVLADDSGLCVPALQGCPGVYSSHFSGVRDDALNNAQLLQEMADLRDEHRAAYFCSTLVFIEHAADPMPMIFQGLWQGEIIEIPRGENGFGYDPLFYLRTLKKTAAELDLHHKNQLSHRAIAAEKFLNYMVSITP